MFERHATCRRVIMTPTFAKVTNMDLRMNPIISELTDREMTQLNVEWLNI